MPGETKEATRSAAAKRYVYCLVDTGETSAFDTDIEGVAGRSLSLIDCGDVGAVVHECESVYDTDDEATIKRWLMQHQAVVDAANDVFGTPLPVRFDTVLEGDDGTVREWLSPRVTTVREHLTRLQGRSEYRVTLNWDSEPYRERLASSDVELQELNRRKAASAPGKRFMLQKQYSSRLRELVRERETTLRSLLAEQIKPVAAEIVKDGHGGASDSGEDGRRQVTQLSVLADESNETALGERLDTVAAEQGVEIRFTGPWPPYSFAPELG